MKEKFILLILTLFLTACHITASDTVHLIRVIDGDTIIVNQNQQQFKIRLLLIDTPEMTNGKHEAYSQQAKQQLEALLTTAETIRLEYEPNNLTDKYDRQLAYVFADDQLVQEILVKKGYAKVKYIHTHQERYLQQLLIKQQQAKQQHLGIWQ